MDAAFETSRNLGGVTKGVSVLLCGKVGIRDRAGGDGVGEVDDGGGKLPTE